MTPKLPHLESLTLQTAVLCEEDERDTAVQILLVEDDVVDRLAFQRAVRAHGIPAILHFAKEGRSALAMLRGSDGEESLLPDAIICDLHLPIMSGHELAELVLAEPSLSHLPIAIVTGSKDQDDRVESMMLGAEFYVEKWADDAYADLAAWVATIAKER